MADDKIGFNKITCDTEPIKMMCNGEHIKCPAHKDYERGYKDGQAEAQMKAEPKHGRWLPSDKGDCVYTCSECGFVRDAYLLDEKAYCPRCGADMREVEE